MSPALDGEVLVVLAGTKRPLTGREVAKLARWGSQRGVQEALRRVTLHGIVDAQESGAAILYALNYDHVLAQAVEVLARAREDFLQRLIKEIGGWKLRPYHASLFGSAARGEGDTHSDIDVFMVRPTQVVEGNSAWRAQLEALAQKVRRWTGNELGLSEVSRGELRRLRSKMPAVVSELRRDAIRIVGPPVESILGAAS